MEGDEPDPVEALKLCTGSGMGVFSPEVLVPLVKFILRHTSNIDTRDLEDIARNDLLGGINTTADHEAVLQLFLDFDPNFGRLHVEHEEEEDDVYSWMKRCLLFYACERGSSLGVVPLLANRSPESVPRVIHLAVEHYHGISSEILALLLECFARYDQEQATGQWAASGRLFIRKALKRRAPEEFVSLLVARFPSVVKARITDDTVDEGLFPLHLALKYGHSFATISLLVELFPEAVQEPVGLGMFLALHTAVLNDASEEIISLLLERFPEGAECRERRERLPIDFATKSGNLRIVRQLVAVRPQCLGLQDPRGRLPLHSCLYNMSSITRDDTRSEDYRDTCLNIVRCMVQAYPQSVQERDEKGLLPLHICVKHFGAATDIVEFLIDSFPESVDDRSNRFAALPIQVACCFGSLATVHLLLNRSDSPPSGWEQADANGDLAIQYASFHEQPVPRLDIFQEALASYPKGIRVANNAGKLPLHRLSLNIPNQDNLTMIRLALDAHPLSVLSAPNNGVTPLLAAVDMARTNEFTFEICQLLLERQDEAVSTLNELLLALHEICGLPETATVIVKEFMMHGLWQPNEAQRQQINAEQDEVERAG